MSSLYALQEPTSVRSAVREEPVLTTLEAAYPEHLSPAELVVNAGVVAGSGGGVLSGAGAGNAEVSPAQATIARRTFRANMLPVGC